MVVIISTYSNQRDACSTSFYDSGIVHGFRIISHRLITLKELVQLLCCHGLLFREMELL